MFLVIVNIQLNAISFLQIEDKILLDVTINDNFKDDSIIISLSKQKSEGLIDFKSTYLAEYPNYSVKELTTNYTYGENRIFEINIFPSGRENVLNFINEFQENDEFIAVSPN